MNITKMQDSINEELESMKAKSMELDQTAIPAEDLDVLRLHLGEFGGIDKVHHATEFKKQLEEQRGSTAFRCKTCRTAFYQNFSEVGIYQVGNHESYMLITACPHCKAKVVAVMQEVSDLIFM